MIDFRIETFLAVCRFKNFSRAGEWLHITQPAVSQHIKYLEDELGRPLFLTKGKSFQLSAAGQLLLRYAEAVEADAARIKEQICRGAELIPLRFGATKTIGEYILPGCLASYLAENPDVSSTMTVDNSTRLLSALRDGSLDFVFIEGVLNRNEFAAELFFSDSFIPVCGASDALSTGTAAFSALLERTLFVRERGSGSRGVLENSLASLNYSPDDFTRSIEIGSIGAIKTLVAAGAGISFLYEQSVRAEINEGKLARILVPEFSVTHDYSFVWLRNSIHAARYHSFLEYCRAHCGNCIKTV